MYAQTREVDITHVQVPCTGSSDMHVSHGSMLAVAEVCLALHQFPNEMTRLCESQTDTSNAITSFMERLPPRHLTTFGSEHIREAACRLIECLALIQWPSQTALEAWKRVVYSSLERKEENVQQHAVTAFSALAATYGIARHEIDLCLEKIVPSHFIYARRGYALALGSLAYTTPEAINWLPDILDKLCLATQVQVRSIQGICVLNSCILVLFLA